MNPQPLHRSGLPAASGRKRVEQPQELHLFAVANQQAGDLKDTDPLMPDVFNRIVQRAERATDDATVGTLTRQMLEQRRDYWLSRIRGAIDYRLGYQEEGQGVVGLLKKEALFG